MSDWEDYGLDDHNAAFQQIIDAGNWNFDSLDDNSSSSWMNQDLTPTNQTQNSSSSFGQQQLPQQPSAHPFVSTSSMSQHLRSFPAASTSDTRSRTTADYAGTQQPHAPLHRRTVQTTVSTQGLAPVADYTEAWLDPLASPRHLDRIPFIDYTSEALFDAIDTNSDWGSEADQNFHLTGAQEDMPTATHSRQRQSVVDLTEEPTSSAGHGVPSHTSRKRGVVASSSGAVAKKPRRPHVGEDVEELDLTNEAPSSIEEELLQNQQQEAINSQKGSDQAGPQKVSKLTCNICLENFTNATITACGHIFCHECIMQALIASERLIESSSGRCPLCRKTLSRKKQNNMIPISFMKRSAFKGRHGIPGTR